MLQLSLPSTSLSVTINRLRGPKLPRVVVNPSSSEITPRGNLATKGASVQNKHSWVVSAWMQYNDFFMLQAIAEESDYRRRKKLNPQIRLIDTFQFLFEHEPRTRAIAPSSGVLSYSPQVGYYAQFNVVFTKPPEIINDSESSLEVDFDLIEGDILL